MAGLGSGSVIGTFVTVGALIVSGASVVSERERSNNELIVALIGDNECTTADRLVTAHNNGLLALGDAAWAYYSDIADRYADATLQNDQVFLASCLANSDAELSAQASTTNSGATDSGTADADTGSGTGNAGAERGLGARGTPASRAPREDKSKPLIVDGVRSFVEEGAQNYAIEQDDDARKQRIADIDSPLRGVRLAATQSLVDAIEADETFNALLEELGEDRIGDLSPTGRYNALYALTQRDDWSDSDKRKAGDLLSRMQGLAADPKANVGPQTRALMADLRAAAGLDEDPELERME